MGREQRREAGGRKGKGKQRREAGERNGKGRKTERTGERNGKVRKMEGIWWQEWERENKGVKLVGGMGNGEQTEVHM